jgi:hypothetical protein
MDYKNYTISINENYWPKHPESKYIFVNNEDCDETIGNGPSIEDCIEQIEERLDLYL